MIHHLVTDGVSWRILLASLKELPGHKVMSKIDLGPKTTSYKEWSQQLARCSAKNNRQAGSRLLAGTGTTTGPAAAVDNSAGKTSSYERSVSSLLGLEETYSLL